MPDLFRLLRSDHRAVEAILAELEGGTGDPATSAQRLVAEESKHEAAEEMYFWPAVQEKLADGDELAARALEQERQGKDLLEELRKADPDSVEFSRLVAEFANAARAHIRFEEQEVWPQLEPALSALEREELGRDLEQGKESGPTRPHPRSSDNPLALRTVGTAAAKLDKVRDVASRRKL